MLPQPQQSILTGLNPEQLLAVTHTSGPLLIAAGAGTGKTAAITRRIAWLVLEQGVPVDGILALTFTDKAAREMEERVDRFLPYGYVDLWISTFHSFCERILQQHALDIGLPNDFRLLDRTATWMLIRESFDRFALKYYRPRGNPTKFIHAMIEHFSRCKDEDVRPEAYMEYARDLQLNGDSDTISSEEIARIQEIASAYHTYQQLLLDNAVLDFGDLLVSVRRLFVERPAILAEYQRQFQYVLVDEFQDTNWTQYEIVKSLAASSRNLTVVGDDDQSVYRWRGASMSNILHFQEDYPDATHVALTTNYRSTQPVLDEAYRLIQGNNPNRLEVSLGLSKRLRAANDGAGGVDILHAVDAADEARQVVERILAYREAAGDSWSWSDVAILTRANRQAEQFIPALAASGIPYQHFASRGLYRTTVVLDILAYLELIDDARSSTAMYRVASLPEFHFSYDELLIFLGWSRRKGVSLFDAFQDARSSGQVTPEMAKKADHLTQLIRGHAERARTEDVQALILAFLEETEYLKRLTDEETAYGHEQVGYLNAFWKKVEAFSGMVDAPTVRMFIDSISLEREAGESGAMPFDPESGPEAVRVLTIHASKGLEFRYVFVVNCVEQRFPARNRRDPIELPQALTRVIVPGGDAHIEEERRLCYVAVTRAKERCILTYADDYGGVRARKPSRFLSEFTPAKSDTAPAPVGKERLHVRLPVSSTHDAVPVPPTHVIPAKLSFTQIRAYLTCPWQYHYAHILKIPLRGRWTLSFGQTMHLTLQQFFEQKLAVKEKTQTELFSDPDHSTKSEPVPSLRAMIEIYQAVWIDDWYESALQQEEYRAAGRRMLKQLYQKYEELGWPDSIGVEQPFTVKFGAHSVRGKIDRVDALPEGGHEIVDYKTGSAKARLSSEDKTQLLIYHVAATQALGITPTQLSYLYLDDGSKQTFVGKDKDLTKLAETIEGVGASIANGKFAPTPGRHCGTCDFQNICPYAQAP